MNSILITPPERQDTLTLPDGRDFAWSEWGPADGLAVIFCTGAGMSGWLGFGAAVLAELGLRLITPDRPGLGRSSPHQGKTLLSWADDMQYFMSIHNLPKAAALGFSQGAPFAIALGARGLVQAVSIVAGQDELSHPQVQPLLTPEVAGMVQSIGQDPGAFEAFMAQMADANGLWRLIIDMSGDDDRALYTSEPFGSAYLRSLNEGFSQGAQGYARDLVNALSPWPFRLEDLTLPVDLWYGGLDTSTVHSPDFGQTLAARIPGAVRSFEPQAGGSILWTHAEPILSSLKAQLNH